MNKQKMKDELQICNCLDIKIVDICDAETTIADQAHLILLNE
jgi:hypothetical protein